MDRTEYLKLCQQVSMFTATHREIPPEMLVKYKEAAYYPNGYEMTFSKGKTQHTAILHDLKANTIYYVDLERVERHDGNTI